MRPSSVTCSSRLIGVQPLPATLLLLPPAQRHLLAAFPQPALLGAKSAVSCYASTPHPALPQVLKLQVGHASAPRPQQQLRQPVVAKAAAAAVSSTDEPDDGNSLFGPLAQQYREFMTWARKFMPMVGLFFLLAFVNTILDSLKDTLVITATGGGAQVIPYLTVYAVLPSSLAFLVAYSYASQHLSRPALFNAIVAVFMAFFTLFAFVLYPNHATLHPHELADGLSKVLPQGVEGLVGMLRNWTFTAFFCMSELWGDVCLGLLFWGLANDTTKMSDAPTLYPLFGLGANVAQALGGWALKLCTSWSHKTSRGDFGSEIQSLMVVVMAFTCAALALHSHINNQHAAARQRRIARRARRAAAAADVDQSPHSTSQLTPSNGHHNHHTDSHQVHGAHTLSSGTSSSNGDTNSTALNGVSHAQAAADLHAQQPSQQQQQAGGPKKKSKPSVREIFGVLAGSTPIRCLAIMSLAQGLCTNLMEFAWKSHIGLLYPSPTQFTAFLGDVSVWQGVVTGCLMVLSPAMFKKVGWVGVARATPLILLWGGAIFFSACLMYQYVFAAHAATAVSLVSAAAASGANKAAAGASAAAAAAASHMTSGVGGSVLQGLVFGGALLYVFSKSAKFSLFKPAEEMVYISLDEEGRTKGKAAIDVVGSQAGKSGGSVLQQALLLLSGGALASILPIMACCYFAMAQGWLKSVRTLSSHAEYGNPDTMHESMSTMQTDNHDSDNEDEDAEHPSHHNRPPGDDRRSHLPQHLVQASRDHAAALNTQSQAASVDVQHVLASHATSASHSSTAGSVAFNGNGSGSTGSFEASSTDGVDALSTGSDGGSNGGSQRELVNITLSASQQAADPTRTGGHGFAFKSLKNGPHRQVEGSSSSSRSVFGFTVGRQGANGTAGSHGASYSGLSATTQGHENFQG